LGLVAALRAGLGGVVPLHLCLLASGFGRRHFVGSKDRRGEGDGKAGCNDHRNERLPWVLLLSPPLTIGGFGGTLWGWFSACDKVADERGQRETGPDKEAPAKMTGASVDMEAFD
jgi:hypothetical protein